MCHRNIRRTSRRTRTPSSSSSSSSSLVAITAVAVAAMTIVIASAATVVVADDISATKEEEEEEDFSNLNCGHVPGTEPPPLELLLAAGSAPAATNSGEQEEGIDFQQGMEGNVAVDATTLHGKIMAGYQGWFDTPCSDFPNSSWRHWAHFRGPPPNGTWYQFEMWPDLSEFDDDELCPTGFTYQDGRPAGLFSSYNNKTVERHVSWMKDYSIDGVFVQRFITRFEKRDGMDYRERCFVDRVLDNVRVSAERHGRVFANMWDVSGASHKNVYDQIKRDWMYLVDVQEITKSRAYLYHKGRPLVSIWGFGSLTRPGEADKVIQLLQWFHHLAPDKYRATVKGGIPNGWQDNGRDTKEGYGWYRAFRKFDVISPWSVGRFRELSGVDDFANKVTIPNAQECLVLGIDYMPVVWPGFSWAYKNIRNPERKEEFNKYPREAGKFFWRQFHVATNAFPEGMEKQVYVAMFDEVDESTAIMKIASSQDEAPREGKFLTARMDGYQVPNDWYLQLMGEATKELRFSTDGVVPEELPKQEVIQSVPTLMPTLAPTDEPSSEPTQIPTVTTSPSMVDIVVPSGGSQQLTCSIGVILAVTTILSTFVAWL